jgi:asparagine synthase (glutamine-hydrolysing)
MCGIGGILRVHPLGVEPPPHLVAIPEVWLEIIDGSIRHRGPDGQGRFRDRVVRPDGAVVDVALVHRRLSIIDHAGGGQPMVSVRGGQGAAGEGAGVAAGAAGGGGQGSLPLVFHGRPDDPVVYRGVAAARPELALGAPSDVVAVVFNGCIYNHRELRKELRAAGHEFVTDHSDTEVLVHGWREWGWRLFERLEGMFALSVWDPALGALALARDAFGEKPLYSMESTLTDTRVVAFASTAAGLVHLRRVAALVPAPVIQGDLPFSVKPWVQFGWNQAPAMPALQEVLVGSSDCLPRPTQGPGGAVETPWGHFVEWFDEILNPSRERLSAEHLDSLIGTAVASRLEADVPLGCFLSGGIDSSLVAAHVAKARPDLVAYTVRMPDARFDESPHAKTVAAHLRLRHEILDCDPQPARDLLAIIPQLGLPFGDSSLLPSLWVSRSASTAVKVALTGDGGDELFAGYDRHRAIGWIDALGRLPRWARRASAAAIPGTRSPRSTLGRLDRLLNASAYNGYKDLVAIFPPPLDARLGLVGRGEFGWNAIRHWGMTRAEGMRGQEHEDWALRFDRLFYLPCDLLRKTDTASMSAPMEVRAPLLDQRLARAAINAPLDCLMPHGHRKGLLRAVARRYLPAEVVDRPKMGFAIPIGEWFRSDYGGMRQLLRDHLEGPEPFGPDHLGINSMINMDFVRRMQREHDEAGEKSAWPWKGRDHSQRLYMLLVLSIWAKWLGGLSAEGGSPRPH